MSKNDPLHGITLKAMLTELQESIGWEGLSEKININCFKSNPSIKSSLTFLRRTPWARDKLENLYLKSHGHKPRFKSSIERQSKAEDTQSSKSDPIGKKPSEPYVNPWLKNKS